MRDAALEGRRWAVVSDENTHPVLGARVEQAVAPAASVVLRQPHADSDTVAQLQAMTSGADALVAVGSGTINDLCKYARASTASPTSCSARRRR